MKFGLSHFPEGPVRLIAKVLAKLGRQFIGGKVRCVLSFVGWSIGVIVAEGDGVLHKGRRLLPNAFQGELLRSRNAPVVPELFIRLLDLALLLGETPAVEVAGGVLATCAVKPVVVRSYFLMVLLMIWKWASNKAGGSEGGGVVPGFNGTKVSTLSAVSIALRMPYGVLVSGRASSARPPARHPGWRAPSGVLPEGRLPWPRAQ